MTAAAPDATIAWSPGFPIDLDLVLGPLRRGPGDPATHRLSDGSWWRCVLTPAGPVSVSLLADRSAATVVAEAWGPGADWACGRVPHWLGGRDEAADGFDPTVLQASPIAAVREAWRRHGSRWRVPASGLVFEALMPAILEQKVTGVEAWGAYRGLMRTYGLPAPGPAPTGSRIAPDAGVLRRVPSWQWRRLAVDGSRSGTVLRSAAVAGRLAECAEMPLPQARSRLGAIVGVGPWTVAEVAQRALGDASAVSYGDAHLPENAVYALTGRSGGTDDDLRELLAPQPDHGYRVQRIVEISGVARPRRGPRMTIPAHRSDATS